MKIRVVTPYVTLEAENVNTNGFDVLGIKDIIEKAAEESIRIRKAQES